MNIWLSKTSTTTNFVKEVFSPDNQLTTVTPSTTDHHQYQGGSNMSNWFNKVKDFCIMILAGYWHLTKWCAIIGLGITAVVIPFAVLFDTLPGWVIWAEIIVLIVGFICYRYYKNHHKSATPPPPSPVTQASEALNEAETAKNEAEAAKAEALAATARDVADAAAKKAEKASQKSTQAATTASRIAISVPTGDPSKTAIDTIAQSAIDAANIAAAAFSAADTAAKAIPANPYEKMNAAMNAAINAHTAALAAENEANAAPDRATANAAVAKATLAYNAVSRAYADANSALALDPTYPPFLFMVREIDNRRNQIDLTLQNARTIASTKP